MDFMLTMLMRIVFPSAPEWLKDVLVATVKLVTEGVHEMRTASELKGAEKRELVARQVLLRLDEDFDGVPEWKLLDEDKKDRILEGVVELVLFLLMVGERHNLHIKPRTERRLNFLLRRFNW